MEHRVNSIQKKALELVYEDFLDLTFQELLAKGKSVGVHQNNLQLGATVIFESEIGMSPELMNHIFQFVERPCNLRWNYTSERKQDYTVYHGSERSLFPRFHTMGCSTKFQKKFYASQGIQNKN